MKNCMVLFVAAVVLSPPITRGQGPPLLSTPTSKDAIQQNVITDALAELCRVGNVTKSEDGKVTGCGKCPLGTDSQNEDLSWDLRHALMGHFVSPNFDTLLLSGRGCEPHSLSFGGTFVFTVGTGKPELLDYRKGLITEDCRKFARGEGVDFLVCADQWGAQGHQFFYLYSVVFDSTGKSMVQGLFTTEDDVLACGADPGGNSLGPVRHSSIRDVRFGSRGNAALEMSVTVTLGQRVLTKAESLACIARAGDGKLPDALVTVPTKGYRLQFLFDGKRFQVAPASRTTLKLFPKPDYPLGIAF